MIVGQRIAANGPAMHRKALRSSKFTTIAGFRFCFNFSITNKTLMVYSLLLAAVLGSSLWNDKLCIQGLAQANTEDYLTSGGGCV